jgi:hypothetical protein
MWQLQVAAERCCARGRRQREGSEAVAELPSDAWSGAGAGAGLGQRGNSGQRRQRKQRMKKGEKHPRVLSAIIGIIGTSL